MATPNCRKRKAVDALDQESDRKAKAATAPPQRKADGIAGEDPESVAPALRKDGATTSDVLHLPAPVWGHVLDFMPYKEVRSALLVCRAIANEAVAHVATLSILNDCELDIPAARRFPNVEHVNILCLVHEAAEHNNPLELNSLTFSNIVAIATVPFLQPFPKLSSIFVGGLKRDGEKVLYSPHKCLGPNHAMNFRSLLSSFVGAYKTRALSQEVSLTGVSEPRSFTDLCRQVREEGNVLNHKCKWCRDACKYLPLKDYDYFQSYRLCLSKKIRDEILRHRDGGPNCIKYLKCICLVDAVGDLKEWHEFDHEFEVDRTLNQKLVEMGLEEGREGDVQYISSEGLEGLDHVAESYGITPRDIPKDLFYKQMSFGIEGREWDVWARTTVESLIARGYPIDLEDLIVVDEAQEPALQRIIQSQSK